MTYKTAELTKIYNIILYKYNIKLLFIYFITPAEFISKCLTSMFSDVYFLKFKYMQLHLTNRQFLTDNTNLFIDKFYHTTYKKSLNSSYPIKCFIFIYQYIFITASWIFLLVITSHQPIFRRFPCLWHTFRPITRNISPQALSRRQPAISNR